MTKVVNKLGIKGWYCNIIKATYDKFLVNILNGEKKLKIFPLISEIRQCPLPPLLFNIVLKILVRGIRQNGKTKGMQIGKEEVKLFLFSDDLVLHTEK